MTDMDNILMGYTILTLVMLVWSYFYPRDILWSNPWEKRSDLDGLT